MTGKTHRVFGLICGVGYFVVSAPAEYQPATFAAVIFGAYLGSLVPDIDNSGADIWHSLPFGHTVGKITSPILKHRNISHSLIGIFIFNLIFFAILKSFPDYWDISILAVLISSTIAYASHLYADSFTVEGIPLLWPLNWKFGIPPKPFSGVRIITGEWFENLIIFPIINIFLIFLVISNWDKIKDLVLK